MSRRCMGAALAAMLAVAVSASSALADGMFVWRNQASDILEPEQKAVILFDHGLEDLALEVRYQGAPATFGWVVPLPARPRMRPDDPELFAELSRMTQDAHAPQSERTSRMFRTESAVTREEVRVLERARVGIYDAAVLESRNGAALQRWLAANHFHAPPGATTLFADYARRGWVFVALRITPALANSATARALAEGSVQPIRFRFAATEPVFPLRISSLGHGAATVLLYVVAPSPLVHRTCERANWEEFACHGVAAGMAGRLDPDSAFRDLTHGHGVLTKLRAVIPPGAMDDVYFRPLDIVAGLASADARTRIESVALLAGRRQPGDGVLLCEQLGKRASSERESTAVLWALGEIGGARAVATLVRLAEEGTFTTRLEAVEALVRLRAPESIPVMVRGMATTRGDDFREVGYVAACGEHLVALGDHATLSELDRLGPSGQPPVNPNIPAIVLDQNPPLADRLLALRAACGDATARDAIVTRLLAGAASTTPSEVRRSVESSRVSSNDFPAAFALGERLVHPGWSPGGEWPELGRWTGLLRPRPELYDDVLRRVAASPATPPIGRTLLLGLLSQPRAADADSVLAMARRALSDPRGPFVLTISTGTFHSRWTVKFDVPVCMAAYALSSMRADSALLVLWREAGSRDEDARGEIAYALARTNSSRAVPAVLEYATTTWNARALAPGFAVEPVDAKGWPRPPGRDAVRLDAEYRIAAVVGLLTGGPDAPARMRRLTTDRTLAPWLRLYWMANLRGYNIENRALLGDLRRELDAMEASAGPDSALLRGIREVRGGFAIYDKVFHEVVEPRIMPAWK